MNFKKVRIDSGLDMYTSIRAAAISIKPRKWDKAHNANKLETFFRKAASQPEKPDLILATEGVLEGYTVMDVIEGRRQSKELLEIAEPINGPCIKRFRTLARTLKTCLAFGFAERVGGDVYNCALFIDSSGRICGTHHKVQLAEGTHKTWFFNRVGSTVRAFDTPLGRVS